MKSKRFTKRAFLNRISHHSVAFIYASIRGSEGTVKIGDCNKTVTLELDLFDSQYDNSLYKLNKLISILEEFKAEVVRRGPSNPEY